MKNLGLPKKILYCKKCVISNQRPSSTVEFKSKKTWAFKKQTDSFIQDIIKKKIKDNKAQDGVKDIKLIEDIWKNYLKK